MNYEDIPKDIHQNIDENRLKLKSLRVGTKGRLNELLTQRINYFKEGYFVPKTPEQLDEEIRKELEKEDALQSRGEESLT